MNCHHTLKLEDKGYPNALKYIEKPPSTLYYRGDISVLAGACVAVVGSRKATDYGRWAAYNLAHRLSAHGVVVVSGMAEGIDSFAHKGALEGPTPTIAVMGNGLDICFPRMNEALSRRIADNGLLLSEYEDGVHGTRFTFPARNRIISGLCRATVVVEAGISSGSLITAECAAAQGRMVYAVPGNINRKLSVGCNKLIRDGAAPLVFFEDILDDLGLRGRVKVTCVDGTADSVSADMGEDEALVLGAVCEHGNMTVDDAAALTGLAVTATTSVVTLLEMKGLIHFDHGRIIPANA
ncbi:MAG: DNA-processing protein DprA [Clostridiales Family XIII bacterium]|jgi:DNA processing protein|nr:DNA-processing protein DprA [Clostridiales Family XIII bacterium]